MVSVYCGNSEIYRYFDVPKEKHLAFFNADSHGRYFLSQIRGQFRYERLTLHSVA